MHIDARSDLGGLGVEGLIDWARKPGTLKH